MPKTHLISLLSICYQKQKKTKKNTIKNPTQNQQKNKNPTKKQVTKKGFKSHTILASHIGTLRKRMKFCAID